MNERRKRTIALCALFAASAGVSGGGYLYATQNDDVGELVGELPLPAGELRGFDLDPQAAPAHAYGKSTAPEAMAEVHYASSGTAETSPEGAESAPVESASDVPNESGSGSSELGNATAATDAGSYSNSSSSGDSAGYARGSGSYGGVAGGSPDIGAGRGRSGGSATAAPQTGGSNNQPGPGAVLDAPSIVAVPKCTDEDQDGSAKENCETTADSGAQENGTAPGSAPEETLVTNPPPAVNPPPNEVIDPQPEPPPVAGPNPVVPPELPPLFTDPDPNLGELPEEPIPVAQVPEPGSIALFGMGLAALAFRRRRVR